MSTVQLAAADTGHELTREFQQFCATVGIGSAHWPALGEAIDQIKDDVVAMVKRECADGPTPFQRFVESARNLPEERMGEAGDVLMLAVETSRPAGEVDTYLDLVMQAARASLRPWQDRIGIEAHRALEVYVLADPLGGATEHQPLRDALIEFVGQYLYRPASQFEALGVNERMRAYCASLGIAQEHIEGVTRAINAAKDAALAIIWQEPEGGAAGPLLAYARAWRPGAEDSHQRAVASVRDATLGLRPRGASQTYHLEVQAAVRRILAPLADPLGAKLHRALEIAVLLDPYDAPTGYNPRTRVLILLARGTEAVPSTEFTEWSAGLGLDEARLLALLGAIDIIAAADAIAPESRRRGSGEVARIVTSDLLESLRFALPPAPLAEVEAGLRACEIAGDIGHGVVGRVLRAQSADYLRRVAAAHGHFTHDPELIKGRFCANPFEYAQVGSDGKMYACCPAMLATPIGDLRVTGLREAWNSPNAIQIRESVLDGSFRFCDGERCGMIKGGALPHTELLQDPEHVRIVRDRVTTFPLGPRTINFSYDRTCNLVCPSCRADKIALKGEGFQAAERIHHRILEHGLEGTARLMITGSGDPFSSRLYLGFLRSFQPAACPNVRIHLSTNGVLLTPAMWESICHEAIDHIDVSIDAATPQTYAINRGGNFKRLVENLHFMGSLLAKREIEGFWIHMVVQANNYHEMPAFAALGRAVGATKICFKELQNWYTYSDGDYEERAVHLPGHPEHAEFLQVLKSPELRGSDVLLFDMGDLLAIQTYA